MTPLIAAAEVFGGITLIVIFVFAILLAICWILLPFLVLSSLTKLRAEVSKTNALLVTQQNANLAISQQLAALDVHGINLNNELEHTNKLVQWVGESVQTSVPVGA